MVLQVLRFSPQTPPGLVPVPIATPFPSTLKSRHPPTEHRSHFCYPSFNISYNAHRHPIRPLDTPLFQSQSPLQTPYPSHVIPITHLSLRTPFFPLQTPSPPYNIPMQGTFPTERPLCQTPTLTPTQHPHDPDTLTHIILIRYPLHAPRTPFASPSC